MGMLVLALAPTPAFAKDVSGVFVILVATFVLAGVLIGFAAGLAGALMRRVGLGRSAGAALVLSALAALALIWLWNRALQADGFTPVLCCGVVDLAKGVMLVLMGAAPVYAATFGIGWLWLYLAGRKRAVDQ